MSKKNQSKNFKLRTLVSVGLLSVSIMSFEILLMQFFSMVQWDHFAAMVISIALLGFGASGTVLSLYRKYMIDRSEWLIPFFMISSGILMILSVRLSQSDLFFFDSYTLFRGQGQFSRLIMTYLLFFLPFFSAALAIGLVFIKNVSNINAYYFSDLFGAGIGAILIIFLLWTLGPAHIFLLLSFIAILSGIILCELRKNRLLMLYGLSSLAVLFYFSDESLENRTSRYKGISYALNLPDVAINNESYSPYGLTQVVSSPALRYAPGLSFKFDQKVHPSPMVYQNGNWIGSIPISNQQDSCSILDYTTMALPYWFGPHKKALLLDVNAGLNLYQALQNKVKEVDVVEPNEMVIDLLENEYSEQTDSLFFNPAISWHKVSRRSFVDQTNASYDLIQLPLLGSFGGGVGLNAMKENNLITIEALEKLWNQLNPNGVLAVSCWIDQPPKMTMKLVNMLSRMLEHTGVNRPRDHIIAVRSWGTMTFVLKKSVFSEGDQEIIEEFCQKYEFDRIQLRNEEFKYREYFNELQDSTFLNSLAAMFNGEKDSIVQNHPFNIRVATDDKPYFDQFLRLTNLQLKSDQLGSSKGHYLELGYLLSLLTVVQVVFLVALLILLPLFKLGRKAKGKTWLLTYFAAIGLGYMFVEIVLIKYFAPYLGHPIYSIATVISMMLIFSGLGSLYATKFSQNTRIVWTIFGVVTGLILLYAFILTPVLRATNTLPLFLKVIFLAMLIGVPAFFMGMPFPFGLKLIASKSNVQVPWAWGINGCLSVISSTLAPLIALEFGFSAVLLFAALAYFFAMISGLKMNLP